MAWVTNTDMIKSEKDWKEEVDLKLSVLKSRYGKYAKKWESAPDDRYLVHSMYNMIVDALKSIKAPINVYVIVAMNKLIAEDRKVMDGIIERFKEMGVE